MDGNTIGGGFTSRCIFVYADKKDHPIAFIEDEVDFNYDGLQADLVADLEHIATRLIGKYTLTPEAKAWAKAWYDNLWEKVYSVGNEDWINNYLARKQAHKFKLAMVIAASQRDELVLTLSDLQLALHMLESTEENFHKVFRRVGHSEEGQKAGQLLDLIERKGEITYKDLFRLSQAFFPSSRDFENIMKSFIQAGQVSPPYVKDGTHWVRFIKDQQ